LGGDFLDGKFVQQVNGGATSIGPFQTQPIRGLREMSDQRKWPGGCLCGSIRYEAAGPRLGSFICYCRMCQRASGSAFAALFYLADENLKITKGSPRSYESSPGVHRDFCGDCGSPLFFRRLNRRGQCGIIAGSLDHSDGFRPDARLFLSDAVDWLEDSASIPGYAEKPAGMTPPLNYNPVTSKIDK
jgi:hypothetical protein